MDVYTELHYICRDLVKKVKYLGTYEAKEHRRMIIQGSGIKQVVPRREKNSLKVKSSLRGSNIRVVGVADFERWKYGDTFLEKS